MSAPVNVRAMGWYSKWRSIVFQKVNECFETFDADVVELFGIAGDAAHEELTAEEFPCLMQDLREAYKTGRNMQGAFDKVQQSRISLEKLEKKLMQLDDDEYCVVASCPATKFEQTKEVIKKCNKKLGGVRIFMAWAQKGDASDGIFSRDLAAPGSKELDEPPVSARGTSRAASAAQARLQRANSRANMTTHREGEQLDVMGGYAIGDKIASTIDYASQNLVKGDIGKVLGPCPNEKLDDQKTRIRCDFGPGKGLLDLKVGVQLKPAPKLTGAGGAYCIGDRVASTIDFDAQNLKVDDVGKVLGECPNDALSDQKQRLRCDFGSVKGLLDLTGTQIKPAPMLAGGYCKGDYVAAEIDYKDQNLCIGDIGVITGACPNDKLSDQKERVRCNFGPGTRKHACARAHLIPLILTHTLHPPTSS